MIRDFLWLVLFVALVVLATPECASGVWQETWGGPTMPETGR